jgi:uncharacterized membrane protein
LRDLLLPLRAGAALAGSIFVSPGIEVKPIEGDALLANRNFDEAWTYLRIEAVFVHSEVARRVSKADEAGQNHGLSELREKLIVAALVKRAIRYTPPSECRCTSRIGQVSRTWESYPKGTCERMPLHASHSEKEKALGPCELRALLRDEPSSLARGMAEGASPGTIGPCDPTTPLCLALDRAHHLSRLRDEIGIASDHFKRG